MFNNTLLMPNQAMPATARNLFLTQCRLNVEASKTVLRCQIELLRFCSHQLQHYQTFLDDLVESFDLNDTFEVVADFTQNALVEAPQESARLAGMASRMVSASAKVVRELADETVEDMGARTCS